MLVKKTLIVSLLSTLLWSDTQSIDFNDLDGNWHLRALDGKEVRKARAILDFDSEKMKVSGFDGCNQITGTLKGDDRHMSSKLIATRMACRESIHAYVSKKLHETIAEGFSIKEEEKYGIKGITLKSSKHELFFKRMGKEKGWF
ncbi:META domain-containing protein [Sulfurovum sp.]|uniref:META domain-containing protein n=1 Tax=Sulfurovum sp. TaxID=1969726 RepID=UPI0028680B3C|nr:META domain-containing protein [Sulfurovum sp.]